MRVCMCVCARAWPSGSCPGPHPTPPIAPALARPTLLCWAGRAAARLAGSPSAWGGDPREPWVRPRAATPAPSGGGEAKGGAGAEKP